MRKLKCLSLQQKIAHFINHLKIGIVFMKQTLSYVISWPNVINKRPFEQLAIKSPSIFVVNKKTSFFRLIRQTGFFKCQTRCALQKSVGAFCIIFYKKISERMSKFSLILMKTKTPILCLLGNVCLFYRINIKELSSVSFENIPILVL